MVTVEEIREHIGEYLALTTQQEELKRKIDAEKVFFEGIAEEQLSGSKAKSCEWHNDDAMVSVVNTASVKIISTEGLRQLFGAAYADFVKTEQKSDIRDTATKRVLAAAYLGETMDITPEDAINQISADPQQRKLLAKKLKGVNPLTDKDNIRKITGCDDDDAELLAAMYAEVVAYTAWQRMLRVSNQSDLSEAIELLRASVIVDRGYKVELTALTGD